MGLRDALGDRPTGGAAAPGPCTTRAPGLGVASTAVIGTGPAATMEPSPTARPWFQGLALAAAASVGAERRGRCVTLAGWARPTPSPVVPVPARRLRRLRAVSTSSA